ncbi:hypothetical protein CQY20_13940 [Mycolicibacterium agri]|uniref:Uncharacterized protein n=1 Tax=Mycolicibacterium agri TaxID=36811 RepID=A0A2A7N2C8_MYCAG|nr:hypothetical protein [Mycolicibacterium agri]PEG38046.1 hypothetical protein CQY20_13940 [Mycolicibacterium agri]GFG48893.1 hypothetical protein MAGR_03340 [Mycolicibacterium agri]
MTKSTTDKLTRIKYAAVLLGAVGAFALAPATAHAVDNEPAPGGDKGCHYTDADGYDIPIDDGQDVFVDGKIVSCRGGQVIVTNPPNRTGGLRPSVLTGGKLPVFKTAP